MNYVRSPKQKLRLCNKLFISTAFSRSDKRSSNLQLQVGDEGLRQNGATGFNYRLKTTSKKSMGAQVVAKISLQQVLACRRSCSATYFTVISFKFPVLEAKVSVSTPRFCSMVTNRLQSGWLRSRLNARCWPWRKPPPASRMGRLVVS